MQQIIEKIKTFAMVGYPFTSQVTYSHQAYEKLNTSW